MSNISRQTHTYSFDIRGTTVATDELIAVLKDGVAAVCGGEPAAEQFAYLTETTFTYHPALDQREVAFMTVTMKQKRGVQ